MFRRFIICTISIAILIFAMGCDAKNKTKEVDQIIYTVDSGPILPELQMIEEYSTTREGVKLVRSGKSSDTQVFEGEWAFTTDEGLLIELFAIAQGGECAAYKRMESPEPPDGGETVTIKLVYADGKDCTLTYEPGTTYEGAEELLSKVREVLDNLKVRPNTVPE